MAKLDNPYIKVYLVAALEDEENEISINHLDAQIIEKVEYAFDLSRGGQVYGSLKNLFEEMMDEA